MAFTLDLLSRINRHSVKTALFTFLCLFLISSNSFSQSGKRDGIHKEFYEDGKLKYEYLVKDEKYNGFYERYDEHGDLEYREYYIDGTFDGTDRENYYYTLYTWYHHIGDEAEEVKLDKEEALERFGRDYKFVDEPFEGNWMGILRTRIPVDDKDKKRFPVILTGISKNYIYLKEFKERKGVEHRVHFYYDLIRKYRVERDYDIDGLFNVDLIEEVLKRRHTAVEFGTSYGRWRKRKGSRLWSVQQYLGEPDYAKKLKPSGWFDVYFEDENLRIVGHSSSVYFMEEKRPEWAGHPEYKYKKKKN